jgi:hypothetical protein
LISVHVWYARLSTLSGDGLVSLESGVWLAYWVSTYRTRFAAVRLVEYCAATGRNDGCYNASAEMRKFVADHLESLYGPQANLMVRS